MVIDSIIHLCIQIKVHKPVDIFWSSKRNHLPVSNPIRSERSTTYLPALSLASELNKVALVAPRRIKASAMLRATPPMQLEACTGCVTPFR